MNRLKKIKKVLGKVRHNHDGINKMNEYLEGQSNFRSWDNAFEIYHAQLSNIVHDYMCQVLDGDLDLSVEDLKFYYKSKQKVKGTDKLQWKVKFKKEIEKLSVNGKVAIVCGGIDCDHTRWDNRVRIVDANLTSVIAWENDYMDSAEGSMWYDLKPMDYALSLDESSRDLAMEAFENGHPHVIYG